MKYKVTFTYMDTVFSGGDDIEIERKSCRFFDTFTAYQDFLQEIDMAGDENTRIISEQQISDFLSGFYYSIAKIIYLFRGYKTKAGRNLFYYFMNKALIKTINNPLCIDFDNKGFSFWREKT